MTELEKELERWRKAVHGSTEPSTDDDYKSNMLLESWTPKWKWFRPPMWKIFRWAYNIKKTLFTGVYPVGIGIDTSQGPDMSGPVKINQRASGENVTMVGIQFNASPYTHPNVEKAAKKMSESFSEMGKKKSDEEEGS